MFKICGQAGPSETRPIHIRIAALIGWQNTGALVLLDDSANIITLPPLQVYEPPPLG